MLAVRLPCVVASLLLVATPSSCELDADTAALISCSETPVAGAHLVSVRCSPLNSSQASAVFITNVPENGSALDSISCTEKGRIGGGSVISCTHDNGAFRFVLDANGNVIGTSSNSGSSSSSGGGGSSSSSASAGGSIGGVSWDGSWGGTGWGSAAGGYYPTWNWNAASRPGFGFFSNWNPWGRR